MSRLTASLAAAAVVVSLAGCGSSAPSVSDFKKGFSGTRAAFKQLGNDLAAEIQGAGRKSDQQLATDFDKLATRAKGQVSALKKLNAPSKFKPELGALTSSIDSLSADLSRIASAARAHDVAKARSATTTLFSDAAKVKSADDSLSSRLGLSKT